MSRPEYNTVSPVAAESLNTLRNRPPKLSGEQIRAARLTASRTTLPSIRRVKMWLRKQKTPVHVGKKQVAKLAHA